jgi:hypothetical protein
MGYIRFPNVIIVSAALLLVAQSGWAQFSFLTNADSTITGYWPCLDIVGYW